MSSVDPNQFVGYAFSCLAVTLAIGFYVLYSARLFGFIAEKLLRRFALPTDATVSFSGITFAPMRMRFFFKGLHFFNQDLSIHVTDGYLTIAFWGRLFSDDLWIPLRDSDLDKALEERIAEKEGSGTPPKLLSRRCKIRLDGKWQPGSIIDFDAESRSVTARCSVVKPSNESAIKLYNVLLRDVRLADEESRAVLHVNGLTLDIHNASSKYRNLNKAAGGELPEETPVTFAEEHLSYEESSFEKALRFISSIAIEASHVSINLGGLDEKHPYFLHIDAETIDSRYSLTKNQMSELDRYRNVFDSVLSNVSCRWEKANETRRPNRRGSRTETQNSSPEAAMTFRERFKRMTMGLARGATLMMSGTQDGSKQTSEQEQTSELIKKYGTILPVNSGAVLRILYYYDTPGDQTLRPSALEDLPKSGLEIDIDAQEIHYGPWSELCRKELFRQLFPQNYAPWPPFTPAPGNPRPYGAFEQHFYWLRPCKLVVPFKHKAPSPSPPFGIEDSGRTGQLSIQLGAGSKYVYKVPWIPDPNESLLCETLFQVENCVIVTSFNNSTLLTAKRMQIFIDALYPVVWNKKQEWDFVMLFCESKMWYYNDFQGFLWDLIADFGYAPQMYHKESIQRYNTLQYYLKEFIPYTQRYELIFSSDDSSVPGLTMFWNANCNNVMRSEDWCDPECNSFLTISAKSGYVNYFCPLDGYCVTEENEYRYDYDVQLTDVQFGISLADSHQAKHHVEECTFLRFSSISLEGYFSSVYQNLSSQQLPEHCPTGLSEGLTKRTNTSRVEMTLSDGSGSIGGVHAKLLLHWYENYFSEICSTVTTEEFAWLAGRLKGSERGRNLKYPFSVFTLRQDPRKNDLDFLMTVKASSLALGLRSPADLPSQRIIMKELAFSMHSQALLFEMSFFAAPIEVHLSDSSQDNLSSKEVIRLSCLGYTKMSFYGPAPYYPLFGTNATCKVDGLDGACSLTELAKLSVGIDRFNEDWLLGDEGLTNAIEKTLENRQQSATSTVGPRAAPLAENRGQSRLHDTDNDTMIAFLQYLEVVDQVNLAASTFGCFNFLFCIQQLYLKIAVDDVTTVVVQGCHGVKYHSTTRAEVSYSSAVDAMVPSLALQILVARRPDMLNAEVSGTHFETGRADTGFGLRIINAGVNEGGCAAFSLKQQEYIKSVDVYHLFRRMVQQPRVTSARRKQAAFRLPPDNFSEALSSSDEEMRSFEDESIVDSSPNPFFSCLSDSEASATVSEESSPVASPLAESIRDAIQGEVPGPNPRSDLFHHLRTFELDELQVGTSAHTAFHAFRDSNPDADETRINTRDAPPKWYSHHVDGNRRSRDGIEVSHQHLELHRTHVLLSPPALQSIREALSSVKAIRGEGFRRPSVQRANTMPRSVVDVSRQWNVSESIVSLEAPSVVIDVMESHSFMTGPVYAEGVYRSRLVLEKAQIIHQKSKPPLRTAGGDPAVRRRGTKYSSSVTLQALSFQTDVVYDPIERYHVLPIRGLTNNDPSIILFGAVHKLQLRHRSESAGRQETTFLLGSIKTIAVAMSRNGLHPLFAVANLLQTLRDGGISNTSPAAEALEPVSDVDEKESSMTRLVEVSLFLNQAYVDALDLACSKSRDPLATAQSLHIETFAGSSAWRVNSSDWRPVLSFALDLKVFSIDMFPWLFDAIREIQQSMSGGKTRPPPSSGEATIVPLVVKSHIGCKRATLRCKESHKNYAEISADLFRLHLNTRSPHVPAVQSEGKDDKVAQRVRNRLLQQAARVKGVAEPLATAPKLSTQLSLCDSGELFAANLCIRYVVDLSLLRKVSKAVELAPDLSEPTEDSVLTCTVTSVETSIQTMSNNDKTHRFVNVFLTDVAVGAPFRPHYSEVIHPQYQTFHKQWSEALRRNSKREPVANETPATKSLFSIAASVRNLEFQAGLPRQTNVVLQFPENVGSVHWDVAAACFCLQASLKTAKVISTTGGTTKTLPLPQIYFLSNVEATKGCATIMIDYIEAVITTDFVAHAMMAYERTITDLLGMLSAADERESAPKSIQPRSQRVWKAAVVLAGARLSFISELTELRVSFAGMNLSVNSVTQSLLWAMHAEGFEGGLYDRDDFDHRAAGQTAAHSTEGNVQTFRDKNRQHTGYAWMQFSFGMKALNIREGQSPTAAGAVPQSICVKASVVDPFLMVRSGGAQHFEMFSASYEHTILNARSEMAIDREKVARTLERSKQYQRFLYRTHRFRRSMASSISTEDGEGVASPSTVIGLVIRRAMIVIPAGDSTYADILRGGEKHVSCNRLMGHQHSLACLDRKTFLPQFALKVCMDALFARSLLVSETDGGSSRTIGSLSFRDVKLFVSDGVRLESSKANSVSNFVGPRKVIGGLGLLSEWDPTEASRTKNKIIIEGGSASYHLSSTPRRTQKVVIEIAAPEAHLSSRFPVLLDAVAREFSVPGVWIVSTPQPTRISRAKVELQLEVCVNAGTLALHSLQPTTSIGTMNAVKGIPKEKRKPVTKQTVDSAAQALATQVFSIPLPKVVIHFFGDSESAKHTQIGRVDVDWLPVDIPPSLTTLLEEISHWRSTSDRDQGDRSSNLVSFIHNLDDAANIAKTVLFTTTIEATVPIPRAFVVAALAKSKWPALLSAEDTGLHHSTWHFHLKGFQLSLSCGAASPTALTIGLMKQGSGNMVLTTVRDSSLGKNSQLSQHGSFSFSDIFVDCQSKMELKSFDFFIPSFEAVYAHVQGRRSISITSPQRIDASHPSGQGPEMLFRLSHCSQLLMIQRIWQRHQQEAQQQLPEAINQAENAFKEAQERSESIPISMILLLPKLNCKLDLGPASKHEVMVKDFIFTNGQGHTELYRWEGAIGGFQLKSEGYLTGEVTISSSQPFYFYRKHHKNCVQTGFDVPELRAQFKERQLKDVFFCDASNFRLLSTTHLLIDSITKVQVDCERYSLCITPDTAPSLAAVTASSKEVYDEQLSVANSKLPVSQRHAPTAGTTQPTPPQLQPGELTISLSRGEILLGKLTSGLSGMSGLDSSGVLISLPTMLVNYARTTDSGGVKRALLLTIRGWEIVRQASRASSRIPILGCPGTNRFELFSSQKDYNVGYVLSFAQSRPWGGSPHVNDFEAINETMRSFAATKVDPRGDGDKVPEDRRRFYPIRPSRFAPELRLVGDMNVSVDVILGWLGLSEDAIPILLYKSFCDPLDSMVDGLSAM